MPDFTVRSDAVNVEQIMEQIRARIREKRGVDYTEAQIRELASVKLEKFLDPRVVRSDLLQQFQRSQASKAATSSITFGPNAIFEAKRPIVAKIRRLLHPVLRLFFNPDPISQALLRLNEIDPRADMYYELFHNLVIELTRTGIEVKNLKMQIESLTGRLEFNERRARALESVVVYQPSPEAAAPAPGFRAPQSARATEPRGSFGGGSRSQPAPPVSAGPASQSAVAPGPGTAPAAGMPAPAVGPGGAAAFSGAPEGPGQRSRRRRRRRGRRGGGSAVAVMGGSAAAAPANDAADGDRDENIPYEASASSEAPDESRPASGSDDDPADGSDSNGEP